MAANPFQLESLSYQTDAVEAVVRVFDGTPRAAAHDGAGNRCPLTWAQLQTNLQAVARSHQISDERLQLTQPAQGQPLDVCVEMETGTGKTLVYLRTLYRLHTAYGWNKFIIVVPSIAIRAGVMGTLADFGLQLAQHNGLNHAIPAFEYDSSRLQQLKTFIDSPHPAIMVMNSQAFVGQGRIISNEENEAPLDGLTWLQALARCRPVVVMDEPQMGMDTEAALKAFDDMKPLAKLRYSAMACTTRRPSTAATKKVLPRPPTTTPSCSACSSCPTATPSPRLRATTRPTLAWSFRRAASAPWNWCPTPLARMGRSLWWRSKARTT